MTYIHIEAILLSMGVNEVQTLANAVGENKILEIFFDRF